MRIWTTRQLCGSHGTWLQRDELSHRHCSLTAEEYSSLTSWLNRNNTQSSTSSASPQLAPDAAPSQTACACTALQPDMSTAYYWVLPPCIRGRQIALLEGDQVEMECLPDESVPREQQISEISDAQLVQHLCRSRAVFSFTINEIGGAHWCTLCTLSRRMGMVYTVCTAGLHAPQI